MRNAFVVLVSLCIGLVSGFSVPSSVPEDTDTKNMSNTDQNWNMTLKSTTLFLKNAGRPKNRSNIDKKDLYEHATEKNISKTDQNWDVTLKSTTLFLKNAGLPKSRSNIDEKDLYEHATEKKNNQSERAFVYINQKYNKKPSRSKLINTLVQSDLSYVLATTADTLPAVVQTPCPSAFDSTPNFNSKFQGFNMADNKDRQEMSSYFAAPDMFRCKFKDEFKKIDNTKVKVQVPASQRVDERREYFELLKSPLLRPVNRKVHHENVHDLPPLSPSNIPYRENYIKKYNMKKQYLATVQDTVARQNEIRNNYGFKSAFIRRPDNELKELGNRVEDTNFEDDFINDDGFRRNFENNQDEDKLLNKYLKDTLDNDKKRSNLPECSQEECILEHHQKSLRNSGLLIKPDCQCARIPSVKPADPFVSRDRSLRQESDGNNIQPKSSEVVFYEELLSEDSNMLKQDDDVIRPRAIANYIPSQ